MDLRVFQMANEAEEGKWFDLDGNTRIKVRSEDSDTYQRVLRNILDSYPNFRKLPRKTQENIMSRAVAIGLLVDWENLTENGQALPCTEDNKVRVCAAYPSFRRYVQDLASSVSNFRTDIEQD